MWLPTDGEIRKSIADIQRPTMPDWWLMICRKSNLATAKKIADVGEEKCPHSPDEYISKRSCYQCWQSLQREIEEGKEPHGEILANST